MSSDSYCISGVEQENVGILAEVSARIIWMPPLCSTHTLVPPIQSLTCPDNQPDGSEIRLLYHSLEWSPNTIFRIS